ncbi:hypothetical protein D1816_16125 [Aquimarina sp. AD10]|uniref:tail fiber protein n=1 Tax=Aquimarina sp. AD10 TaxID=1714849 RepID=UPI000E4ADA73|nr:tail fiber protein [Aquimarina sp. AD10]AXT61817.1 hypothetical protein D1816_16125 [Aquimarina sp. AD10]RKN02615.1 hypothetical protein D7033_00250 [Aquimarina sp. AD10]
MKRYIFTVIVLGVTIVNAQNFDNLIANYGINKSITWFSSNYGSGFGHRIINHDPGGQTLLKFQGRHNSATWLDYMTLTSKGRLGIGTTSPSSLLALDSPGTTELTISGDHTGAINAGLVLKARSSVNQRGLGMFMYDTGGQNEWFAGRPYSGSDTFVIYRRDNLTNHDVLTSSLSHNTGNKVTKALFSINNKGNVGIGTKTPSNAQGWHGALDVRGASHSKILATSNIAGVKTGIFSHGANWKGVVGRLGTESNHDLRLMAGYGKDQITIKTNGNVGIGTTIPDARLAVKGSIHAEEVKIDLSVPAPDYVFKKGYDLLTIEEVQQHIQEKGHLPNIPSAEVMENDGVALGVMNMKLLEKIEELTLYTIQQETEIKELKLLNKKLLELQSRLEILESR